MPSGESIPWAFAVDMPDESPSPLLIIEDDARAADYLLKGLNECGHVVDLATDGEDGLHLALNGVYDTIVVDRMLPARDGLSIIRILRADENATPVLVLSALSEVDDRVTGKVRIPR